MKGGALQTIPFDPLGGARENVLAIVIKAQNERSVYLNAVVMEDSHSPCVIGGLRGFLVRVGQVFVGEGFETDEDTGTASEGHIANQARIVGNVDGHRGAPILFNGRRAAQRE